MLTSYHGMPVTYLERGDVYHCQCYKTTRLVRDGMPTRVDLAEVRLGAAEVEREARHARQ